MGWEPACRPKAGGTVRFLIRRMKCGPGTDAKPKACRTDRLGAREAGSVGKLTATSSPSEPRVSSFFLLRRVGYQPSVGLG